MGTTTVQYRTAKKCAHLCEERLAGVRLHRASDLHALHGRVPDHLESDWSVLEVEHVAAALEVLAVRLEAVGVLRGEREVGGDRDGVPALGGEVLLKNDGWRNGKYRVAMRLDDLAEEVKK